VNPNAEIRLTRRGRQKQTYKTPGTDKLGQKLRTFLFIFFHACCSFYCKFCKYSDPSSKHRQFSFHCISCMYIYSMWLINTLNTVNLDLNTRNTGEDKDHWLTRLAKHHTDDEGQDRYRAHLRDKRREIKCPQRQWHSLLYSLQNRRPNNALRSSRPLAWALLCSPARQGYKTKTCDTWKTHEGDPSR